MATLSTTGTRRRKRRTPSPASPPGAGTVLRTTSREDLLSVVFGTFGTFGLFTDGWAHTMLSEDLETFFTPWHAITFGGYLLMLAWFAVLIRGRMTVNANNWRAAVPDGYLSGVVGLGLFIVGFMADGVWHTIFGIEDDIEALLSPSHLLLLVSVLLVGTSAIRSAWRRPTGRRVPTRDLVPAIGATTLVTMIIAFFFMYLWAFTSDSPTVGFLSAGADPLVTQLGQTQGLAAVIITTILLLSPVLLLLRRWELPPGAVTAVFTLVALAMSGMLELKGAQLIPAASAGGIVADVLIARLRPGPQRTRAVWIVATAVPAAMWSVYFLIIAAVWGVGWPVELATGAVVLGALTGAGLALLTAAPAIPVPDSSQA